MATPSIRRIVPRGVNRVRSATPWSPDESSYLLLSAHYMDDHAIAHVLGRSAQEVGMKRLFLKLRSRIPGLRGDGNEFQFWSAPELSWLAEYTKTYTLEELANCLRRSTGSVRYVLDTCGWTARSESEGLFTRLHSPDKQFFSQVESGAGREWTEHEIQYLRDHTSIEDDLMAHLLIRNVDDVISKRAQIESLDIATNLVEGFIPDTTPIAPDSRTGQKWTDAEVEFLKEVRHTRSAREIATFLGRSPSAVSARLTKLKVRPEIDPTTFSE